MDQIQISDDCLARLAAGESRASILTRYPGQAQHIAPMLEAAHQLTLLADARLSDPQRMRAKVALRAALAARRAPRPRRFAWASLRSLSAALVLAVMFFAGISISAVAQSRPGDFGYSLRVMAERTPILFQVTPAGRASAHVGWADRRLGDVRALVESTGMADRLPLDAMLAGDQAAAERADLLSDAERASLAARVDAHAQELQLLAETASDPQDVLDLRQAADQARTIASSIVDSQERPVLPRPGSPTSPAPAVATPTGKRDPTSTPMRPTAAPAPTAAPTRTVPPVSPATRVAPRLTERPRLTHTPWPKPRLTVLPPGWLDPTPIPWPVETPTVGATDGATPTPAEPPDWDPDLTLTPWPAITPWPARTAQPRPSVTRTRIVPPFLLQTPTATTQATFAAPTPSETPAPPQTPTVMPASGPAAGGILTASPMPTLGAPLQSVTPALAPNATPTPQANRATVAPFITMTVAVPDPPRRQTATAAAGAATPSPTSPPGAGSPAEPTVSPAVQGRRP